MLKRKFYGPRKFVSREDDAVKSGYDEFVAGFYDWSKLELHPGKQPTVFHIKPLSSELAEAVDDLSASRMRNMQIFRGGVEAVENLELENDDGSTRPCPQIEHAKWGKFGMMVPEQWIASTQLEGWLYDEVAAAIWRITEPGPT